jgi:hypothetical protein
MRSFIVAAVAAVAALAFAGAASATDSSSPGLGRRATPEVTGQHLGNRTQLRCHGAHGRPRPCPVHGIAPRPHRCGFNQICDSHLPHL